MPDAHDGFFNIHLETVEKCIIMRSSGVAYDYYTMNGDVVNENSHNCLSMVVQKIE